jgi:tRNA threonylcarbamoyladenosine dehydratase
MITEDYQQRFGGIARLYGVPALARFAVAHVGIIGVGGVGSWVVEALARSGIGALTLIDLDDVCITNTNRQLPALEGSYGRPKVNVLADRIAQIHPGCRVNAIATFVTESNATALLDQRFDLIIDAVDRMSVKAAIITTARALDVPVITSGSAGGRRDPTCIRVTDLGLAGHDPLLQQVRRKLRRDHGWAKAEDGRAMCMDVPCVFSSERPVYPQPDGSCAPTAPAGADSGLRLDCAAGYGAATHVTGAFAFAMVGEALRLLGCR